MVKCITKMACKIKFNGKCLDNATEIFNKLIQIYGDQVFSRRRFLGVTKYFWTFWSTSHFINWEKATKVRNLIRSDQCLMMRILVDKFLYSLHNGFAFLHKYTSTRASDGVHQPAWHNQLWYHLHSGRIVTTTLDSQLSTN